MLKKLDELKIANVSPFENDALDRVVPVKNLTSLIESTQQPFVLSIEAPWGWGKTTFIRMWKAYMESKGHNCFLFNAWQNDFVDDPLVAFIGEMAKHIEEKKATLKNPAEVTKYLSKLKTIGVGVFRKALPISVQVATHGLLSSETVKNAVGAISDEASEIADFASKVAKERLKQFESERKGIDSFRSNLESLANEIAIIKSSDSNKGEAFPLVFFVDEMDRCRPDFAIALLERVKHLFNVPKVVFVLAVDRGQLNESVKAIYGLHTNPDGYLRRFIDLAYTLPAPATKAFVESLYNRFSLHERVGSGYADIWKEAFIICSKTFSLSLRAQEQCFTEMNIVWRTTKDMNSILPTVLSFYSAIRAWRPGIFDELRQGRMSIDSALDLMRRIDERWYKLWFEAALIQGFCDDRHERQKFYVKIKENVANSKVNEDHVFSTRRLSADILSEGYRRMFLFTMSQLEMATQFR